MDALQGCDLTEEFVLSKATRSGAAGRELTSADGGGWYEAKAHLKRTII